MKRSKRRRLGQNFLVDHEVAERIVGLLDAEPPRVLEIGPGRGALTEPLLDRFERVRALELDEPLVAPLEERFGSRGLEVLHADALTVTLDGVIDGQRWQVASNLPYSVGTAILRRLLPRHDLFTRLVVMLQLEVAERVVATPGSGNHGLMALERAAWADGWLAFNVSPRAFRPRPRVTSAVVVLDLRPAPADEAEVRRALELAARALTKPRKMLPNALGKGVTGEVVERAGLDPKTRPGELSLDDWIRLVRLDGL
ncbi:MAG: 16S rRNA (adenine(1518)-N(6)/adenine(1519)-N(6))-dimethyltransferase RsmA [Thermoanaerobaculales bacterium]|nr:16S rRNA (adenine(1518)-N(6)/adenine(1519)-N(6))-dimethyltransferase RsmA [Thermoanaerobaculales bacterium]